MKNNLRILRMFGIAGMVLLATLPARAQQSYVLHVVALDQDSAILNHEFSYRHVFVDTVARYAEMKTLLGKLFSAGYLEASFRKFTYDSFTLQAALNLGRQWQWATLHNGNVDDEILSRTGFHEKLYDGKPLRPQQVNALMQAILQYAENNGYPFASVRLDSLRATGSEVSAEVFLEKNQLITLDSLSIRGDVKIAKAYLANYLGFRFPAIYQEDLVQRISTRLRELPFCSEAHAPMVTFNGDHAVITLSLKKKTASRFDFVLGVLPNSSTSGKLLVTGDGQLSLVNPLGRGENIFLSFSQLQSRTTQAELKADYPYLFNLPFGVDGDFTLYKNDSLYLDVKEQVGVKYLFTGVNYLKIFFRNDATSILSFDSLQVIQSRQLPSYLDLRTKYYGLEYRFEHLDYRFNPSRGWSLLVSGEAGSRKVRPNAAIEQLKDPADAAFNFATLYDSLDANEAQFIFKGSLDKYWQLSPHSVFLTSYHGASIFSNEVFENELFRIGGFQLLRGFNEQSVFVSQYHIGTLEFHYLLGQNSFFYVFMDGGYVANTSAAPRTHDHPFGFGAGINFETRAGIFGVSYALGSQQNNPVEFRNAKIHFGYVNYF